MYARSHRQLLHIVSAADYEEGGRGEVSDSAAGREANHTRQRATLSAVLHSDPMTEFFIYYVKGRVFEWTMAIGMLFAGLELLIWDNVLTFGAFRWILLVMSQKWVGTALLFIGWLRLSALMFNGQLLFGRKLGWAVRAGCAVLSATIWTQFTIALLTLSIDQGFPSIGLPFWGMFIVAELVVAFSIGAEWQKK